MKDDNSSEALSEENRYKSLEVDKSGGVSETFWWSEQGRLEALWEHVAAVLSLMWIGIIIASLSTFFVEDSLSFAIVWVFIIGCTITWWLEIQTTKRWLDEHYSDWEETNEAILGSQKVSKGRRRDE